MKRFLFCAVTILITLTTYAEETDFFTPYKSTSLRLPSVPIVVNDPYLSIWSPYNKLNDGSTRHWTNAEKAIDGLLRVDGVTYRFMGTERPYILKTLLPMADEGAWTAKTCHDTPDSKWTQNTFDDSDWAEETGAFGTQNEYPNVYTSWTGDNKDIYVRRHVTLTAEDINRDLYLVYSHDDVCEIYVNGMRVVNTGLTWNQNKTFHFTTVFKRYLKEGDNIICCHVHNTNGGSLLDYGLYYNIKESNTTIKKATQTSVDVLATNTYYTFNCGNVDLDLVFTAPMIIDDLDLLSTPINYISYRVRSTDGNAHDIQFYLATTPQLSVNQETQQTASTIVTDNGITYMKAGTTEQPTLKKSGDAICIDWGYLYFPNINGNVSITPIISAENEFATNGALPDTKKRVLSTSYSSMPALTYVHDFGSTTGASSFALIGYDEVKDITYMGNKYPGYWARDGKTIKKAFEEMRDNYTDIMNRCRATDKMIYDDALAAGSVKYAEILSASYRQVIAAHKLFEDNEGHLLFFSKENNSNGCVNTVDLTYPSAPLFLKYNPDLEMGMMTSIFEYSYTGRWTKPFAAHDLGTYPIANGQVYGGDMPIEESGNMLTLAATIAKAKKSADIFEKYWSILKTWADYLVENGQDPENQLCTDDFAGHWAHNCNLSLKAIMGVAGFAELASIKGDKDTADEYMKKAKSMAEIWVTSAKDGDHYRLAFDKSDTWSQKYNLIWDKLWSTNLFPAEVSETEIEYYLTKQNKYGLPLDCRKDYTKNDWIMWTAAMADDNDTFLEFVNPIYDFVNETNSRVPISDWYDTKTGNMVGFKARSVIGGFWMKVLMDDKDLYTAVENITETQQEKKETARYNVSGQRVTKAEKGVIFIKYSDGSVKKTIVNQ